MTIDLDLDDVCEALIKAVNEMRRKNNRRPMSIVERDIFIKQLRGQAPITRTP